MKKRAGDTNASATVTQLLDGTVYVTATQTVDKLGTREKWIVEEDGTKVTKILAVTSNTFLGPFTVTTIIKGDKTSFAFVGTAGPVTTSAIPTAAGDDTPASTSAVKEASAASTAEEVASITEQGATQTAANTQASGTNTAASATSTGSHHKSSGISSGAVAGAAIGCLLGGLLIGALAAFLFFRRRNNSSKKRHSHSHDVARVTPVVVAEKSTSAGSDAGEVKLDHFLLDATPDKQIGQELRGLGDLVNLHVDNNYHLHPVNLNPASLAQSLQSLGLAPESASVVANLAIDQRSRALAIRHIIAAVGIASIDVHAKSPLSLLPAPVAAFLQSMPPSNGHSRPQAENNSLALSKWRALSAYLLHPSRDERLPLSPTDATSLAQVQGLASALNTAALGHFIEPSQLEGQTENLQAVLLDFAKFGYVLLSQPSDWGFVYEGKKAGSELVLRAGLRKLTHRDGSPYASPPVVVAPDVVQLA